MDTTMEMRAGRLPLSPTLRARPIATQRLSGPRCRALADHMCQLVWIADGEGRPVWFNRRWYEYTGATSAEMDGTAWRSILPARARGEPSIQNPLGFAGRKAWEDTVQILGRDGSPRWFLVRATPDANSNDRITRWFGTCTDVTESRMAGARAQEATARLLDDSSRGTRLLRSIVDATPDLVFAKDREGRFTAGNPALFAMMAGTEKDVIGRSCLELLGDSAFTREILADEHRVMDRGEPEVSEEHETRPDGSLRVWQTTMTPYRDPAGGIAGILAIGRDITKSKREEAELRVSEERFRVLADSTPNVVWTADREGRVDYWNQRAVEYFGLPFQAKHGAWDRVVHRDDLPRITEAWHDAFREQREFSFEYRIRRTDGLYRWHLCRAVPLLDAEGRLTKWLGSSMDIGEQKDVEHALEARMEARTQELEHRKSELRESHGDIDQFVHLASHDLQESLRMMASFAQLLSRRYADQLDADASEFIGYIVDGAARMQRQIHGLLAYAWVGRSEEALAEVDANEIVRKALASLAWKIEANQAEVRVMELPRIRVRPRQFEQVFHHLIENALKYRIADTPPRIAIRAWPHGERWVFSIKDNGIGVDPHLRDGIFQIFQRVHAREDRKGSGVGLAVCRKIVEFHCGRIWLDRSPEGGADFRFDLPGGNL